MAPPDIIETLEYEAILQELKDDMSARMAADGLDFDVVDLESDPAVKILEVAADREVRVRARVNGAAKALLLALSKNMDLEHLGAWFGVERQVVIPAVVDETGAITTPAVMEDNERLRKRIQLAPQAFSTAGPVGAYEYHVMTAVPAVKSVGIVNPRPGVVQVYPLTIHGDGSPTEEELKAIRIWLAADDVRPLTDQVQVAKPAIFHTVVSATIVVKQGPDPDMLVEAAIANIRRYADSRHQVGAILRRSAIFQHAHVADAIDSVIVHEPAEDFDPGPRGAVYVDDIVVGVQVLS
jgi:phage-related baseplate assembly protein